MPGEAVPAPRPAGGLSCVRVGPLPTNCYLLDDGEGGCVVVDPGAEAPAILAALDGRAVSCILVTHAHFDHLGALAELAARSRAGWCVGAPDAAAAAAGDPVGARMFGMPAADRPAAAPHILEDGDELRVGALCLRALACPGHSPGGVTYLEEGHGLAFTGDTLFAGAVGRCDLAGGDERALRATLARLARALPGAMRVLPGHGRPSTMAAELASNPYLR